MRIAVFSDIHSNSVAFKAALTHAEKIGFDACVLLGDYVSDCAYPERTIEMISEVSSKYPTEMIKGNREEYLVNHLYHPNDGWKYNSRTGSLLYTFEHLSKDTILSFEEMPIQKTVSIPGYPPFEIAHGSFTKSRAQVIPGHPDTDEMFSDMKTNLALVGHTHFLFVMQKGRKTIANAGPVGVPSRNMTGACFLMLESKKDSWQPSIHRVEYDINKVIREIDESGLAQKSNVWARGIKAMLKTGREYLLEVLDLVKLYSGQTGLSMDDESLWDKAAKELGI